MPVTKLSKHYLNFLCFIVIFPPLYSDLYVDQLQYSLMYAPVLTEDFGQSDHLDLSTALPLCLAPLSM